MNGNKQRLSLLSLSVLVFVSCTSAAYILPDSSLIFTHCVGPACPTFSLPMAVEKPGAHRSMKCNKGDVNADPADCQSFYVCSKNGTGIKLTCTNGYAFHPRIKMCVPESLVKSCGKVYCPPSVLIGMVPDPINCTRYYKCVYGVPLHYQCEMGFTYDEELGKCMDYGNNVPTCVNGEVESIETSTTEVFVTPTSATTTTTTTTVTPVVIEETSTQEAISIPVSSDSPVLL